MYYGLVDEKDNIVDAFEANGDIEKHTQLSVKAEEYNLYESDVMPGGNPRDNPEDFFLIQNIRLVELDKVVYDFYLFISVNGYLRKQKLHLNELDAMTSYIQKKISDTNFNE